MAEEEAAAASALADNIDRKGRNAYYYAHAHKSDGPDWDGKEEPQLLKTESTPAAGVEPVLVAKQITNYAWGDEDMKVKVYIDLPKIGELPKENITLDWTPTSFTLTIRDYEGGNLKLHYGRLFAEIENAKIKTKPEKILLTLFKTEETAWPCMNEGTPSK
ncbi:hypothetical protein TeGR_g5696 [Tetraparma gracilis]|uniref:CS domain-containing protein n=1 Tax=Tetraparma gracilis TaxID=2962635 RepID=A0ABQ6N637_9STRA|nr:hypothetical protein TeGR_g5696 [Tetraparma gracilis]